MKILVTGAAGFIGAAMVKALLGRGHEVVGLDNINSYYDTGLKYARLADTGIAQDAIRENGMVRSSTAPGYRFVKMDLTDRIGMDALFASEKFDAVINLAAQAGVRYSIENPYAYIESNVVGFINVLENCRRHPVRHLVYASSSSVYGMNDRVPYSESDVTDKPVSLYAATKKSNEQMAFAYSHLYGIPATGVRFFTVYGPWGRPDMAPFIFLRSIMEGKPIKVFNHGEMQRDFTYIDDIVGGLTLILDHPPVAEKADKSSDAASSVIHQERQASVAAESSAPHRIYNIGHSDPVNLMDFIRTIERVSGRKAVMEMEDMQAGDVLRTYADTLRLRADLGYCASTPLEVGITRFYGWYRDFYRLS